MCAVAYFLVRAFPEASEPDDIDDAIMEYKQSKTMTKSEFENLIAALEHARPALGPYASHEL